MKKVFWSTMAIMCMGFAAVLFYYNNVSIPELQKTVRAETLEAFEKGETFKEVAIVTAEKGIEKDTVLTQETVNKNIEFIRIPEQYILGNLITEESQLVGMVCKQALMQGEPIHIDSLGKEKQGYEGMERLREYTVYNTVGNMLSEGSIVDIIVSYSDGSYDVVVAKKDVKAIASQYTYSEDKVAAEKFTNTEAVIVISVDEIQYTALEKAKLLGKLEVRLYLDSSQPQSKITFLVN